MKYPLLTVAVPPVKRVASDAMDSHYNKVRSSLSHKNPFQAGLKSQLSLIIELSYKIPYPTKSLLEIAVKLPSKKSPVKSYTNTFLKPVQSELPHPSIYSSVSSKYILPFISQFVQIVLLR